MSEETDDGKVTPARKGAETILFVVPDADTAHEKA